MLFVRVKGGKVTNFVTAEDIRHARLVKAWQKSIARDEAATCGGRLGSSNSSRS